MNAYFFNGALLGLSVLITIGIVSLFLTTLQEGQVKVVKTLGQFSKALMAFRGREFRCKCERYGLRAGVDFEELTLLDEKNHDPWDVMKLTRDGREKLSRGRESTFPLFEEPLGGLRIVGIPKIHVVPTARFSWVSLEQVRDEESGKVINIPVFKEERLNYGLVQEDIYVSETGEVETADLLPVDIMILVTAAIVNPRKALFNIQHWLEATHNQIRSVLREYVGTKKFANIITQVRGGEEELREILINGLKTKGQNPQQIIAGGTLGRIINEYGVDVRKVQIFAIDPTEAFRTLTTKKYEGEMEAKRIKEFYSMVQKLGDVGLAMAAFETLQKTQSNITLVGEKSNLIPTMQLVDLAKNGLSNDHFFLDAQGVPIHRTENRR